MMVAALYSCLVLFVFLRSALTQDSSQGCRKEEFSCSDGSCIPDHFLCNGVVDCNNGLDEFVCIERRAIGCPPDMIPCGGADPNECVGIDQWCDGIDNCMNGEDETDCGSRLNSSCLISQFECPTLGDLLSNDSATQCVPRAHQCNGNQDCSSGGDELGCSPPVIITPPMSIIRTFDGSSPSLLCEAEGTPTPTVTWLRDLLPLTTDPRYVMVSEEGRGVLLIRNATTFDQGTYSCIASNPIQTITAENRTELQIMNDDPFICTAEDGGQYTEGTNYYYTQIQTFGEASTAAADVVFVVDESGSMVDAHEWIRTAVPLLQQAFMERGVGVGLRENLFALVGFGRNTMPQNEGVALTDLTSVERFLNASHDLATDGLFEDGYSGIEVALDQINLRSDSIRLMVLASNEPRLALANKQDLNRTDIEKRLQENGFTLNTIVAQGLLYDANNPNSFAFALDSNNTAYSFLSPTEFTTFPGGIPNPDPSFTQGTTYEDYTRLALDLGGAVFDIQQIQTGGSILEPFTQAFIDIKVEEVLGVSKRCFKCICREPTPQCTLDNTIGIDNCSGIAPPNPSLAVKVFPVDSQVIEGDTLTLTCEISVSPANADVQVMWRFLGFMDICSNGRAECMGNVAIVRDFMLSDAGFYTCQASTLSLSSSDLTRVSLISPPVAMITDAPEDGRVASGKPLFLTCTATGVPSPAIIWRYNGDSTAPDTARITINTFQQGMTVTSEFVIDPAVSSDSGEYECTAINSVGSDNDNSSITVLISQCTLPDGSVITPGDSKVIFYISESSRAADIVLIVDESGSMNMEHQWIINTTRRLDQLLQDLNIGRNISNRFGIVGFGSYIEEYNNGRIVTYNGRSFVSASEVEKLINMLTEFGRREDGYLALKFAYDNYQFRSSVPKQFILVSDEERDIIDAQLRRTDMLTLLEGSQLGVIISEGFENIRNVPAIGIDSLNNAYIYDPLSPNLFRLSNNGRPIPDSGYVTTNQDYTQLALQTEGSAWNLLLLRQGGKVAEAFTEAFILTTTENIYRELSQCLNCTCDTLGGTICNRLAEYDGITECNITKVLESVLPDMPRPLSSISVDVSPSVLRLLSGFSSARLSCSIEDRQNQLQAVFVWTLNGGLLPDGVQIMNSGNTSTLVINPVTLEHNGRYTCLVRTNDAIGSGVGIMEIRMLESPLGVAVTPPESTVVVGQQNVSFRCSSSEPAMFEWSFNNGLPLPDSAVIQNFPMLSILTLSITNTSNQGRYFCIARDTTTNLLTDQDFSRLYVITPLLKLSLMPSTSVVVETGSNVSLVCALDCVCNGASLTWIRGFNETLPENAQVVYNSDRTEATLNLYNVQQRDCDLYTCIGKFFNQEEQLGTHVILRDMEDFEVMLNTGPNVTLEAGTNQSLICSSSSEVSTWQWLFNGNTILPDSVEVFNLDSNRTLLFICDVQSIHVGAYQCEGISPDGGVASDVTLIEQVIINKVVSLPTLTISMSPPAVSTTHSIIRTTLPMSSDQPPTSTFAVDSSSEGTVDRTLSQSDSRSATLPGPGIQPNPGRTSMSFSSPSIEISLSSKVSLDTRSSIVNEPITTTASSSLGQPDDSSRGFVSSSINMITSSSGFTSASGSSISHQSGDLSASRGPISSTPGDPISSSHGGPKSSSPGDLSSSTGGLSSSSLGGLSSSPGDLSSSPGGMTSSSSLGGLSSSPGGLSSSSLGGLRSSPVGLSSSPSGGPSSSPGDPTSSPGGPTSSKTLSLSSMGPNSTNSSTVKGTSSISASISVTHSIAITSNPNRLKSTNVIMTTPSLTTNIPPLKSTTITNFKPMITSGSDTLSLADPSRTSIVSPSSIGLPGVVLTSSLAPQIPITSSATLLSNSGVDSLITTIVSPSSIGLPDVISTSSLATQIPTTSSAIPLSNSGVASSPPVSLTETSVATVTPTDMYTTGSSAIIHTLTSSKIRPNPISSTINESPSSIPTVPSPTMVPSSSDPLTTSTTEFPSPSPEPPTMMLTTPQVSVNELNLLPGSNATITCISNTPATLTWSFNNRDLPDNVMAIMIDKVTSVLVITNFNGVSDRGSYSCLASAGGIERGVLVPVNAIERISISISSDSLVSTPNDNVPVGEQIRVVCRLECRCGGASVEWRASDGGPLPDGVTSTTIFTRRETTLIFTQVDFRLADDYICVGSSNSQPDTVLETFTLGVVEEGVITVTPSEITVGAGEQVKLVCSANRAVVAFVWTYRTRTGALPLSATVTNVTDLVSELVVTNIRRGVNDGQYFCQGMFDITFDEQTKTGNIVQRTELTLSLSPQPNANDQYIFTEGDPISIRCIAPSSSNARAEWSEPPTLPSGLERRHTSFTRKVHLLRTITGASAQISHSGMYTCRVFNNEESATQTVQIIIVN